MNKAGSHWAELGERGVYTGLAFTLFVYRRIGRWALAPVIALVVGYFFVTSSRARRAAGKYLELVRHTIDDKGVVPKEDIPARFGLFWSFGNAILDKVRAWSGQVSLDDLVYTDRHVFENMIEAGEGGVLIASHLGNIDLCRAMAAMKKNIRLNVLVHTRHAENFNRLMKEVNGESGLNLVQVTDVSVDTALMLREKVAAGEFVVIVGDRVPVGQSSRVSDAGFLGKTASFPQGGFILASLLDCPVALIFCFREKERFRVVYESFSALNGMTRRTRKAFLEKAVRAYAERLEFWCCRYPGQWYNFFDFWGQE